MLASLLISTTLINNVIISFCFLKNCQNGFYFTLSIAKVRYSQYLKIFHIHCMKMSNENIQFVCYSPLGANSGNEKKMYITCGTFLNVKAQRPWKIRCLFQRFVVKCSFNCSFHAYQSQDQCAKSFFLFSRGSRRRPWERKWVQWSTSKDGIK